MLLVLPIIPSRNSDKLYPLFLFYSRAITNYSYIVLEVFMVSVIMTSAIHIPIVADESVHLVN